MTERRGFLAGLFGFFGLGTAGAIAPAVPRKLEGFIVLFVDIGQLPTYRADAYMDRLKEHWEKRSSEKRDAGNDLIENWQTLWIPTRVEHTHAEFYPINEKGDAKKIKEAMSFRIDMNQLKAEAFQV